MSRIDFRAALEQAKNELAILQQELGDNLKVQDMLEKKIAALRQMITAFSDTLGEQFVEEDVLGLTDAIRQAFKTSGKPMAPTDVKKRLEQLGYNTSKYGNMMASVHSILNRLVKQGDIKQQGTFGNGKPAYMWVKPSPSAIAATKDAVVVTVPLVAPDDEENHIKLKPEIEAAMKRK